MKMINPIDFIQMKAFARQDGLLLALVWVGSFLLTLYQTESSWGAILLLSTPLFVGWRLAEFRRTALDGYISFRRAFAYCLHVFTNATLLFTLFQFIYFKYLDNGAFMSALQTFMDTAMPLYKDMNVDTTTIEEGMAEIKKIDTVSLTMNFMFDELILGFIVSPMIAVLSMFGNKRN